jgi:alkylation response protein AidB-like acyl-CoA dehydrogenase
MDFRFNDEQRIWHETVHNFMDKEVGREYTREHDASREFPWEVYKKMGEQGWLGLLLPEADGGVDLLHDGVGAAGEPPAPHLVAHEHP